MPATHYRPAFYLLLSVLVACSPDTPARQAARPATPPASPTPGPVSSAPADTLATYVWESDVCRYTGRYSPGRYRKAELDGTWEVLNNSALRYYNPLPFQPAGVERMNLDSLDDHYRRARQHLAGLAVVGRPVWEQLKQARQRELEEEYRAIRLAMQAFARPEVLLTGSATCQPLVRGLATGNDSLTRRDWHRYTQERQQQNGRPDAIMARYLDQAADANWLTYAKIDLLTFAWWNCVNEQMARPEPTAELYKQFDQLFVRIDSECDDVD
ncbi:hypothetical protein LGH70_05580 [Hymenobacter sp. BT635]|uniref:DUF5045 domain-containing protein n=1 Tax=Hymenobacter nitidus TaxID=2880929 RepID=A0ABS8A9G7_9BACT|nr:hypothetical protein [Hymenobacter nitidus]MCB2377042.1 hypothetical protein [Hymenobacter nitidus]